MLAFVGLSVANFGLATEPAHQRDGSTNETVQSTPKSVLDAETVSIALASASIEPEKASEKFKVSDLPVSGSVDQDKVSEIAMSSDEPLTTKDSNIQVEKSSPSRTSADDVIREIVVLNKETGSRYKVITVKFPADEESTVTTEVTTNLDVSKPTATDNKDITDEALDDENDQHETKAPEKEEAKSEEKESAKDVKKNDRTKGEDQNRKVERKNDKKKEKESVRKDTVESDKKPSDKSSSKYDSAGKKRTKRNTYEKKSSKGKERYSSKNREKKNKNKAKN